MEAAGGSSLRERFTENIPAELIRLLLDFIPSGVCFLLRSLDEFSRIQKVSESTAIDMIEYAAGEGYVGLLGWLKEIEEFRDNPVLWNEGIYWEGARGGHVEVLEWAKTQGIPLDELAWEAAEHGGHLKVFQWLHGQVVKWDVVGISSALMGHGKIELLEWALANGMQWGYYSATEAAEKGHIHVLEWAHEHGCPFTDDLLRRTCSNLAAFKWLRERGCNWDLYTLQNASLEVVKWAKEHGCPSKDYVVSSGAARGDMEHVKWAIQNGFPVADDACYLAAGGGHLEILKYLREVGGSWDNATCNQAAQGGHLEVLKWAREHGCAWSAATCADAAMGGRLHVLQWAHEHGCEWGENTCYWAARGGHLEVLKYAVEQGCPWSRRASEVAAEMGRLNVLQWALERGLKLSKRTCMRAAADGELRVLLWLLKANRHWATPAVTEASNGVYLTLFKQRCSLFRFVTAYSALTRHLAVKMLADILLKANTAQPSTVLADLEWISVL